jgi:hypothetical protein
MYSEIRGDVQQLFHCVTAKATSLSRLISRIFCADILSPKAAWSGYYLE